MIYNVEKNIAISINSNYLKYALTMLYSFFKNNKYSVSVYLLYSSLNNEEINKIKNLVEKNNSNLICIKIENEKIPEFITMDYFSIEASYRLLLPYVLPVNVKRVVWIDSDMIIRSDISELFYLNIEDNVIACCKDISHIGNSINPNLSRLKIKNTNNYFNSGLVVFNVNKYKELFDIKEYNKIIKKLSNIIKYPDQDILNYVFQSKIYELDSNYNVYFTSNYKHRDKNNIKQMKQKGKIYHYISGIKPDNYRYLNFGFNEYWKYAKKIYGTIYFIKISIKNYFYRIVKNFSIDNNYLLNKKSKNHNFYKPEKNNFSIVCNNCVGGIIYNRLGLEFSSPFINLWIGENDYFNLLNSLEKYLKYNLELICFDKDNNGKKYPVCKCKDINLNCTHYNNFEEINNAWERRKKRFDYDNYICIFVTNSKKNIRRFLKTPNENKICICPFRINNKHVVTINTELKDDSWYQYVIDYFKNYISSEEIISMFDKCFNFKNK